jgi:hypothetical protein
MSSEASNRAVWRAEGWYNGARERERQSEDDVRDKEEGAER